MYIYELKPIRVENNLSKYNLQTRTKTLNTNLTLFLL